MNIFQKIAAGVGGIGILALAIWLGTIIFLVLLIAAPFLYLFGRWKMGKLRKEFEKAHAEAQGRPQGRGGVIEGDYVIVEETRPLDENTRPRQ